MVRGDGSSPCIAIALDDGDQLAGWIVGVAQGL
jgi:hypothetical protein